MVYKTAWEEDTGQVDEKELHTKASMCKLYASEMVGRVADRAVQILGGRGYCADYAAERLYREVRVDRNGPKGDVRPVTPGPWWKVSGT
jgi:acyl-CoA dehydrogenase